MSTTSKRRRSSASSAARPCPPRRRGGPAARASGGHDLWLITLSSATSTRKRARARRRARWGRGAGRRSAAPGGEHEHDRVQQLGLPTGLIRYTSSRPAGAGQRPGRLDEDSITTGMPASASRPSIRWRGRAVEPGHLVVGDDECWDGSSPCARLAGPPAQPRRCRRPGASSRQAPSISASMRRLVALSSTTRTRQPVELLSRPGEDDRRRGATANRAVKWNVLPCPSSLSTQIRPPISSTSRLVIASPSPVPPKRRVVELSACVNASKIRSRLAAGCRRPVSRTTMWSIDRRPPRSACARRAPPPRPRSVNFMALPTRLTSTCRRRPGSPTTCVGHGRVDTAHTSSRPFSCARRASGLSAWPTVARRSKSSVSSSMRPASIFEKSRMSLMTCRSAWAEVLHQAQRTRAARR